MGIGGKSDDQQPEFQIKTERKQAAWALVEKVIASSRKFLEKQWENLKMGADKKM